MSNLNCPFLIDPSWQQALHPEWDKSYISPLIKFIDNEYAKDLPVYPPKDLIFNALNKTPFDRVRVVIIGQDPYHGPGQAHGLAFSVPRGIPHPPSLKNIFKELQGDLGISIPKEGSLESWADQGVLLLNATLTVSGGNPLSHHGQGWELFTDAIVRALVARNDPLIFVLWGKSAEKKCHFLAGHHHSVLTAPHPSPLSAYHGFFGCKHFSRINQILETRGEKIIDWQL